MWDLGCLNYVWPRLFSFCEILITSIMKIMIGSTTSISAILFSDKSSFSVRTYSDSIMIMRYYWFLAKSNCVATYLKGRKSGLYVYRYTSIKVGGRKIIVASKDNFQVSGEKYKNYFRFYSRSHPSTSNLRSIFNLRLIVPYWNYSSTPSNDLKPYICLRTKGSDYPQSKH